MPDAEEHYKAANTHSVKSAETLVGEGKVGHRHDITEKASYHIHVVNQDTTRPALAEAPGTDVLHVNACREIAPGVEGHRDEAPRDDTHLLGGHRNGGSSTILYTSDTLGGITARMTVAGEWTTCGA